MNKMVYYALAGALLLGAGCRKQEKTSEAMSQEKAAEKPRQVATPPMEQPATVGQKAEAAAKQVTEQAEAAVSTLKVKAEDVMGDLNQSVDAIKDKVAEFDKTQLLAYVDQYKTVILEKKDQIAALTEQIKAIPMTEMMGEKTLALKEQLGKYTQDFTALKERYTVYLDKLKEYGVDLSSYAL